VPKLVLPAAGCIAVLLAAGCATPYVQAPPPVDPPGRYIALTKPVIALGDTQEHESTGFPLVDNDSAIDEYVEVAQRPPEAPLFSRRILEWVIENHTEEPVIHLGDVLDMSCRSELRRMVKLGMSLTQPGAVLPGNHDGLLFGIFNYDPTNVAGSSEARRWNMGCWSPPRSELASGPVSLESARGEAVTKREFITTYLDLLAAKHPGLGLAAPRGPGARSLSWRNPDPAGFIEAIEARVTDGRLYSASYVAQKLSLPAAPGAPRRVKMIGLDTNQLLTIVGIVDTLRRTSPGDIGSIDADQIDAITPWIEEARRAGDLVVFAGHHNWAQLSLPSQARLAVLMNGLDHPLVYISAHTHRGFWAQHQVGLRPLLELNVSSLSDWPIAYRRLAFHFDADANRVKVVGELLPKAAEVATNDTDLLLAWTQSTCAKTGVPVSALAAEEMASIRRQKSSRASLWEWMVASFDESCDSCKRTLFDHAHAYQDQLLTAIVQMESDLGPNAWLHAVTVPPYCAGRSVVACAAELRAQDPQTLDDSIRLFRRKARLVDRVNAHLDDLADPRAKNYMACRAIVGAKIDFEETAEADTPGRSEAYRRAGHFFRIEATVGMR
jgi:hypothetical protein